MILSRTPGQTGLLALLASLAFLLVVPLGLAALKTSSVTGPAVRSLESTAVGQVVRAFSADADAAISRSRQSYLAAERASFFCFAWQCRNHYRRTAVYSRGTLKTTWRISYPKNILWHGNCRTYANMLITVTSTGGVRAGMISCG